MIIVGTVHSQTVSDRHLRCCLCMYLKKKWIRFRPALFLASACLANCCWLSGASPKILKRREGGRFQVPFAWPSKDTLEVCWPWKSHHRSMSQSMWYFHCGIWISNQRQNKSARNVISDCYICCKSDAHGKTKTSWINLEEQQILPLKGMGVLSNLSI